jgi:hypothetical protein
MIEVNNFEQIKNLIEFDGKSIYLVWLVLRNKDGNTEAKGNNRNRTIKSYYFQDLKHFEEREQEIIDICKMFNCRAYICLNKKPIENVLFEIQDNLTDRLRQLMHGQTIGINGMLDHAVMKAGTDGNKLWIVDIDVDEYGLDEENIKKIEDDINTARSSFFKNVITRIPTAHGLHIVTHPFNINDTKIGRDVKKEGLTLLYAKLNE